MPDTSFAFGWNATADNAAPWGRKPGDAIANGNADSSPDEKALDNRIEMTCNFVLHQIKHMTREVRKANRTMPSASEILKKAGGTAGNLLHGSDVPKKTTSFEIAVTGFREAPDGFEGSLGLLDIKPIFDCEAWSLNKTNFKAVMNALGDNTDKWKGRKIKLAVIQVRNPKTGTYGPSLAVAK